MANQDGSEDFDLEGANVSDGDDDFDWASLDEPENTRSDSRPPADGFTTRADAIPFQDKPAATALSSATAAPAATGRAPGTATAAASAAKGAPQAATAVPTANVTPAAGVAPALGSGPEPSAGTSVASPPKRPVTANLPAPPARSHAASLTGSPAVPSPQSRPSPAAAGTPPAPRYATKPPASSPAAAAQEQGGAAAGPVLTAATASSAITRPPGNTDAASPAARSPAAVPSGANPTTAKGTSPAATAVRLPPAAIPVTPQGTSPASAVRKAATPTQKSTKSPAETPGQAAVPSPTQAVQQRPASAAPSSGSQAAGPVMQQVGSVPATDQPAAGASTLAAATPQRAADKTAASTSGPGVQPVHDTLSPGADEAAASSSSSAGSHQGSGGGWGWGFGGLSNKLQQVAVGAAKDFQELTTSVQQAYAEVVAADDISEVDRLSAYQARPPRPVPPPTAGSTAPPPAMAASRDSQGQLPTIHEPDSGDEVLSSSARDGDVMDADELQRLKVLYRLQGHDTQLQAGLKVIDDQVEVIAASAAKALGSLWGGFSNVAKTGWTVGQAITTKVEAAAKEVAKDLAVGLEEGAGVVAPVTSLAERLAARAEKGLESVGHVGASLLDPQAVHGSSSSHHTKGPSDWSSTFESCFELYGGAQAAEELEQLSSECAGICNRARAKLQQEHREQIDHTLSKLVPAFDLRKQQDPAEGDAPDSTVTQQQQQPHPSDAMQDGLEHIYQPVAALCNRGKHKAQQLQHKAESSAVDAIAQDGTPAPAQPLHEAAAAAPDEIQPEVAASSKPQDGGSGQPEGNGSSRVQALLDLLMAGLRSAAVKSLAEVSAGQLMVMLALGRSVAAVPRYGKPLDDGLEWPSEPDQIAAIMKQQVHIMLDDIQHLAGTFKATAPQLLSILQSAASNVVAAAGAGAVSKFLSSKTAQQQASLVVEEVAVDCNTAVRHLTDGFGKLLYVVLLSSLHQAGKPAATAAIPVDSAAMPAPLDA